MSDDTVDIAKLKTVPNRRAVGHRLVCPHCQRGLPVDEYTECDQCGAHLRLCVRTTAPPVGEWDDAPSVDEWTDAPSEGEWEDTPSENEWTDALPEDA